LSAVAVAPAAANPGCGIPPEGVLTKADLPAGTSVIECRAQGRVVSHKGVAAQIPKPGTGVIATVDLPDGGEALNIAVDEDGIISYPSSKPATESTSPEQGVTTQSAEPACYDEFFKLWESKWATRWYWYLGDGVRPDGMTTDSALTALRDADHNIKTAEGECGLADTISAVSTYNGITTAETDFHIENTPEGTISACGDGSANGRDGRSTQDFGNLDYPGDGEPAGATCHWYSFNPETSYGENVEVDIRYNTTDVDFYNTRPGICFFDIDLMSVAVHEMGHAYGLDDIYQFDGGGDWDAHSELTMWYATKACDESNRTLGRGDWKGLSVLY
jgi:hypothetical protein